MVKYIPIMSKWTSTLTSTLAINTWL